MGSGISPPHHERSLELEVAFLVLPGSLLILIDIIASKGGGMSATDEGLH